MIKGNQTPGLVELSLMSTKLVTLASLKLSNAGDSEKQALDCSANFDLSTSKTNNGITYSAKAAENTLTTGGFATKGVLGPVLEVSKAKGVNQVVWLPYLHSQL